MRLANRSYTQVKVEISEGLGGGSRQIVFKFPTTYIHISKQRGTTSLWGRPGLQGDLGNYTGGLGSMSVSATLLGKHT